METLDIIPDSKSDNLTGIPYELIVKILSACDVLDVIHLRCCCKNLCLASKDRFLWVILLTRLSNHVSTPFYPPFLNTLTSAELEKMSISHIRFGNLVLKHKDSPRPHSMAITSRRKFPLPLDNCVRADIQFLWGGRYLLVLAIRMELWDLGVDSHAVPKVVAFYPLQIEVEGQRRGQVWLTISCLVPVGDGGKFGFCVTEESGEGGIYNLVLNDGEPYFRFVGKYPNNPHVLALHGDGMMVQYDPSSSTEFVEMYDSKTRRCMSLPLHCPEEDVDEITFLDENTVVTWSDEGLVQILELPVLSSLITGTIVQLDSYSSMSWTSTMLPITPTSHLRTTLDRSLSKPHISLTFHTIFQDGQNGDDIIVYTSTLSRNQRQRQPSPSSHPSHRAPYDNWTLESTTSKKYPFHYHHTPLISECFTSPNNYQFLWWRNQAVSIQLLFSNLGNEEENHWCNIFQWDPHYQEAHEEDEDAVWPTYSLSPFLCRLAVSDPHENCIGVYEYL